MIGDILILACDTLVIFGSIGLGALLHARKINRGKPKPKNLMCGCDHELSYHDPKSRICNAIVKRGRYIEKKTKSGNVTGTIWIEESGTCSCKVYTGDLPDDWYARTLGAEAA